MSVTDILKLGGMSRWEPNTRARLAGAALELYAERGFEQTTVAEIARRTGLTERTFFRHFADKREVLFGGSEVLSELLGRVIAEAPDDAAPIAIVAAALEEAASHLNDREHSRKRQAVIDANPELQERELIKMATWSAVLAAGLRERGVPGTVANLSAEAGVAVFKVAVGRWLAEDGDESMPQLVRESFKGLRDVVDGGR